MRAREVMEEGDSWSPIASWKPSFALAEPHGQLIVGALIEVVSELVMMVRKSSQ